MRRASARRAACERSAVTWPKISEAPIGLTMEKSAEKASTKLCAAAPVSIMRGPGRVTHSPWRISGSAVPSAVMPSTSVSAEPIIQSTWMRLRLAPAAASAASSRFWSTKHFE